MINESAVSIECRLLLDHLTGWLMSVLVLHGLKRLQFSAYYVPPVTIWDYILLQHVLCFERLSKYLPLIFQYIFNWLAFLVEGKPPINANAKYIPLRLAQWKIDLCFCPYFTFSFIFAFTPRRVLDLRGLTAFWGFWIIKSQFSCNFRYSWSDNFHSLW